MPSIFSRSRTASSPSKKRLPDYGLDEFGRVNSRGSFSTSGKKEKNNGSTRSRTLSTSAEQDPEESVRTSTEGGFLPLNLNPFHVDSQEREQEHPGHDYGYLSYKRHVVLGLEQVVRLVEVTTDELGARGLTTPFIFSALALDVSASAVNRLIESFLQTCHSPDSSTADRKWRDEARFAGPHELGICLRWGLARVVRFVGAQEIRGLLSYDSYVEWKDSELAMKYPPSHFSTFLEPLHPILHTVLVAVLTLLTRLTAHSASSGHTPPSLSPLFGPLFFGLGPSSLSFHHSYHQYLHATNATEHILLAFIRWQDEAGSKGGLGVPSRLKDWIRGYPSMLPVPPSKKQDRPLPRKGARTVRVVNVRRNVRMYSPDLVKTAASWGHRPRVGGSENGLAKSKEWERIAPSTMRLQPRYSDNYRKRMNLPTTFHPDARPGSFLLHSSPSPASTVSSSQTTPSEDGTLVDEDRFRSLTDLKWGEFEASGFGNMVADGRTLQFDLTEGARAARAAKRATLTWTDFSAAGFSRTDGPLNTTLQFSAPVIHTINQWPTQSAEIAKKLKKTQRALPPFGWDTEPVMAVEQVIEEAFIDVFCDLVYGGGWMDSERCEEVDRECNWALVEFKSLSITGYNTDSGSADPRSSSTLVLFEEFVPHEYRQQLATSGTGRRRLPSLFSSTKPKQWKPAPTLNGRPYTVGSVPPSPHYRAVELEGILRGGSSTTKVLRMDSKTAKPLPINKAHSAPPVRIQATPTLERAATPGLGVISNPLFVSPRNDRSPSPSPIRGPGLSPWKININPLSPLQQSDHADGNLTPRKSLFRLPSGLPTVGPGSHRKSGVPPAQWENIDFETRMASYSDEDLNNGGRVMNTQEKRRSKDDAWVDIMIAGSTRRYGVQDAEPRNAMRGLKAGRSDPELASQEVAQALAAAKGHPPSSDEEDEIVMSPIVESDHLPVDNERHNTLESRRDDVRESHREPPTKPPAGADGIPVRAPFMPSPPPKPRVTYFDIHPERRPVKSLDLGEELRMRLAYDDSESDDHFIGKRSTDFTTDLDLDSAFDHSSVSVNTFKGIDRSPVPPAHSKTDSMTLPTIMLNSGVPPDSSSPSESNARSKTATLIEMYREKERVSLSPQPGQKVRALPVIPAQIPPSKTPPRTPSPSASEEDQSPSGPGRVHPTQINVFQRNNF